MDDCNEMMAEIAGVYAGAVKGGRPFPEPDALQRDRLDYSLASLGEVDRHLKLVRMGVRRGGDTARSAGVFSRMLSRLAPPHKADEPLRNLAVQAGAYAGEAMRRAAPRFNWFEIDDVMAEQPSLAGRMGEDIEAGGAVLLTPEGELAAPIGHVAGFLAGRSEVGIAGYFRQFATGSDEVTP